VCVSVYVCVCRVDECIRVVDACVCIIDVSVYACECARA